MRLSAILLPLVAGLGRTEELLNDENYDVGDFDVPAPAPTPIANPVPPFANTTFYDGVWAKVSAGINTECKACPYELCVNKNVYPSLFMFRATCWTNGEKINDTSMWLRSEENCYVTVKDTLKYFRNYTQDIQPCEEVPQEVSTKKASTKSELQCKRCPNDKCETIKTYPRKGDLSLTCRASSLPDCLGNCASQDWAAVNGSWPWVKTSDNCYVKNSGIASSSRRSGWPSIFGGWFGGSSNNRQSPVSNLEDCGPVPYLESGYRAPPAAVCNATAATVTVTVTSSYAVTVSTTFIMRPPPCETCPPLIWAVIPSATLGTSLRPNSALPTPTVNPKPVDWGTIFEKDLPAKGKGSNDTTILPTTTSSNGTITGTPGTGITFVSTSSPAVTISPSPSTSSPIIIVLSTSTPITIVPSNSTSDISISPTSSSPIIIIGTTSSPIIINPTTSTPIIIINSTTSTPITIDPTTSTPITISPTTSTPITIIPTTSTQVTISPTTSTPITIIPTTSTPITIIPTSSTPTTIIPTSSTPITIIPTSSTPITISPTSSQPVIIITTILTLPPIIITTTLTLPPYIVTGKAPGAALANPLTTITTQTCNCAPYPCATGAEARSMCSQLASQECSRSCVPDQMTAIDPFQPLIPGPGRPPPMPAMSAAAAFEETFVPNMEDMPMLVPAKTTAAAFDEMEFPGLEAT